MLWFMGGGAGTGKSGRSRYWRARNQIDWNIPFSFNEVVKPEINTVEVQIREQKTYKKSLLVIKDNNEDDLAIRKEIERVEARIQALLTQKQACYDDYYDYIREYRLDKQKNRELKKAYLAAFKAEQDEEDEMLELIELGAL